MEFFCGAQKMIVKVGWLVGGEKDQLLQKLHIASEN